MLINYHLPIDPESEGRLGQAQMITCNSNPRILLAQPINIPILKAAFVTVLSREISDFLHYSARSTVLLVSYKHI